MLGNVRHGEFSVGYLPPGRQLQRSGYTEFDVQRYDIRAQLHTIDSYSAHADRSGVVSSSPDERIAE
ncbi:MBL fold metallo-hydrolase RNA specificity domain-containing protein [Metapseudomonas otitidis]|uniref:MBL fold metallo-hydrolase RNA specificity domain-containing protein n=1 Tax=Metapseudomonas otitidis TaxID=319939 RepID=UPI0037425938